MLPKAAKLGFEILQANVLNSERPFKLTFCITYRCQSRCKTCNIWQMKPEKELTLEEIRSFIKKNNFFSWVNLTGGEPFLREDLVEICKIFSETSPLYVLSFSTNGLTPKMIPEKLREILSFPISRVIVGVSLDGSEVTNDEIRGIAGDWKKAIETYKALRHLSKEFSHFRTYLGYTLSPWNRGKFFDFFEAVKKEIDDIKPKDIHVNLFHHSSHYYHTPHTDVSRAADLEELKQITQFRSGFSLDPVDMIEMSFLKLGEKFLETGRTPFACKAATVSCFVDSWGNVFPCTIYDKKLGSLRENDYDLMKILRGNIAMETKKEAHELRCPNCWTACEAYPMIFSNLLKRPK